MKGRVSRRLRAALDIAGLALLSAIAEAPRVNGVLRLPCARPSGRGIDLDGHRKYAPITRSNDPPVCGRVESERIEVVVHVAKI